MVEVPPMGSCRGDHTMMGPPLFGSCLLGCLGACELADLLSRSTSSGYLVVSCGSGDKTVDLVGFTDGPGCCELADLLSRSGGLGGCEGVAFLSFSSGSASHGMVDPAVFVRCPDDHERQDIGPMPSRDRQVDYGRVARWIIKKYGRVAHLIIKRCLS